MPARVSVNNKLAKKLDTLGVSVIAVAGCKEPTYDGNVVGGDYECWCEIASVGIVWFRQRDWDASALEIMLSNIPCLICGQVARDGQAHTYIFSILESLAGVSAAKGLLRHYSYTDTLAFTHSWEQVLDCQYVWSSFR